MGYRMGRGGYYGDPGFFGNLFRAVTRTVGGAAAGLLTGGPLRAITGAVGGAISATRANIAADAGPDQAPVDVTALHMQAIHAHEAMVRGGATSPIGGSTAGTPHGRMLGPGKGMALATTDGVPRGFHVAKTRNPNDPSFGKIVRNRRMNWANPRALGRAERRAHSFLKHARRFISYFAPSHKKGRPFIRRKKR